MQQVNFFTGQVSISDSRVAHVHVESPSQFIEPSIVRAKQDCLYVHVHAIHQAQTQRIMENGDEDEQPQ